MNTYLRSVLLTVAGCHLLLLITTELGGEHTRRILRFLCGIILLLTIFAPLQGFTESLQQALERIYPVSSEENISAEDHTAAISESAYAYIADSWMTYLTEKYDIFREDIRVIFHTDAENILTHAEIALQNCYYALRQTIETDMNTQTDIPITVKGW